MNDFKSEPEELRIAQISAIHRVLESGWYVLGKEVQEFERRWADLCGVAHAVGVGNGMDAIEIALRSLSIGSGDEVITTPMTAFATILAIIRAGATPVFADIDSDTALLSIESTRRCVSPRTRAVLLVHLYGQVRQMSAWQEFCEENGLLLIEDCAQAHLATFNNRPAGSFGIAGTFSYYPTKNLGAMGDGGMLVMQDTETAERARRLRNYGQADRYCHDELGLNSRLDEIQAAILLTKLEWLPNFTNRRRKIAREYRGRIAHPLVHMAAEPESEESHVYHLFVINSPRRDDLQAHLQIHGIQSLIHYPIPAHQQKCMADIKSDPMGLPSTEAHAKTCLSLPCHPQMTDNDVDTVINAVNAFREL